MILFQTTSYKSVISYLRMTLAWLQNFMIFIDYKQLVSIQLHQIEHVSLSFKAFLNPSHWVHPFSPQSVREHLGKN